MFWRNWPVCTGLTLGAWSAGSEISASKTSLRWLRLLDCLARSCWSERRDSGQAQPFWCGRAKVSACGKQFGKGLGGVIRVCCRDAGHSGRCTDMPFLVHLEKVKPKVANKIVRDSFNTRGASWGRTVGGTQARRNRQPRWTLQAGDGFYPAHHQTYAGCLVVAAELTVQAYEMVGAPACPEEAAQWLPKRPVPNCRDVPDLQAAAGICGI